MKKVLFLALAASLSLASCTHNENSAEQRTVQDNTDGTPEGAQPAPGSNDQLSGGDGPASIEGTDRTTTNNGSSIYGGPTSRSTTPEGSTSTTGRTATTTSASSTAGTTTAGTTAAGASTSGTTAGGATTTGSTTGQ
jgi:hypothetical protein